MQKSQLLFIVSLIFAIIVTIFALTNSDPVVINLLFLQFEASQALVIFFSAALGAITVTLLGLIKHIKLKSEVKKLKKEKEELMKENQELRDSISKTVEVESVNFSEEENLTDHKENYDINTME